MYLSCVACHSITFQLMFCAALPVLHPADPARVLVGSWLVIAEGERIHRVIANHVHCLVDPWPSSTQNEMGHPSVREESSVWTGGGSVALRSGGPRMDRCRRGRCASAMPPFIRNRMRTRWRTNKARRIQLDWPSCSLNRDWLLP